MNVLVTGATGFVGRHVVEELLKRKEHKVFAIARSEAKEREMSWSGKVPFIPRDIYTPDFDIRYSFNTPDVLIHLAWSGLPNYKELFHYEENLFKEYHFLKRMVSFGVKHILVAGTCFEYGKQEGQLSEETLTNPCTPYGLAKDTLRRFLQELQRKSFFTLQWVRLFYMYGPGQNPNSILSQLDKAIENNEAVFNMSWGEQLRDYLPIEQIAKDIVGLLDHPDCSGIINCCSGKPISVRSLVERRIEEKKSNIKLNLGYYPYNTYEPLAFWGDCSKLNQALALWE